MNKPALCTFCGAMILRVRTAGGKHLVLDEATTEDGAWEISSDGIAHDVTDDMFAVARHRPHFLTCPFSDRNRKGETNP